MKIKIRLAKDLIDFEGSSAGIRYKDPTNSSIIVGNFSADPFTAFGNIEQFPISIIFELTIFYKSR